MGTIKVTDTSGETQPTAWSKEARKGRRREDNDRKAQLMKCVSELEQGTQERKSLVDHLSMNIVQDDISLLL